MKTCWALAMVVALAAGATAATPGSAAAAAEARPIVIELFTSQGCSSCPPADAVLAELAKRTGIIALGFHVDYWDGLGWRDPLSAAGSTARQNAYAAVFGRKEIYTPQMVIDGVAQLVGSNRAAVLQAVDRTMPKAVAPVSFSSDMKSVTIGSGEGAGTVILLRYVRSRSTEIRRGENAGKLAWDVNGVDAIVPLGMWRGAPLRFTLDPIDPGHGLAVLVQAADGRILGAAATSATES